MVAKGVKGGWDREQKGVRYQGQGQWKNWWLYPLTVEHKGPKNDHEFFGFEKKMSITSFLMEGIKAFDKGSFSKYATCIKWQKMDSSFSCNLKCNSLYQRFKIETKRGHFFKDIPRIKTHVILFESQFLNSSHNVIVSCWGQNEKEWRHLLSSNPFHRESNH